MRRSLMRGVLFSVLLLPAVGRVFAQQSSNSATAAAAAIKDTSLRIIVSVARRRLWAVEGAHDTLLAAPVAVGSELSLSYGSHHWSFRTPRGIHTVLAKEENPVWIPPDWHYVELARHDRLKLVWLHGDTTIDLHDGSSLVLRHMNLRIEDDSSYDEIDGDWDIIAGSTLFVPPIGSPARRVTGQLGAYRLLLGDGVGIHGTTDATSIGRAATHGCMRLRDGDVAWLYEHIPVGTHVYVY